jgi:hypothetical protein
MAIAYIAFDPGGTTGWYTFDEEGKDIFFGQCVGEDELIKFLDECEPPTKMVIIEDFKLFSHKAIQQSGSQMIAPQIIGILKLYCNKWKVPYVLQPSNILTIAQLWSGVKVDGKGGHAQSHWKSAFNHGVYYLQKNGIRKSRLQP